MPFDVVVIGAGSAGCAVAAALAESGVRRIGLVEAGPGLRVPAAPSADGELAVWQRTFLDAAVASGVRRVADVGDPAGPDGVAPFHANVVNGVRFNAAFAFLARVRGTGAVTVLADTLVDRLELDRARAVAVHGVREGTPLVLRARRFVLCAGTYGSPAILLRSGVGPPRELRA